jgi:F-type H+-transporting ATPase subunit b
MRRSLAVIGFAAALAAIAAPALAAEGSSSGENGGKEFVITTPDGKTHRVDEHELEEKGGHIAVCALEAAVEEKDPAAECLVAPNPVLPEVNEIVWGSAAFLVVFLALAKFGVPAVRQAMQDRAERIRSDLDRAEQARAEAERTLEQYQRRLAEAKAEANRIVEEARQQADQLRRDLQAKAEEEIAEMRRRAQADIDATRQQAVADLRDEVAAVAFEAAEAIVGRALDREAHRALVDDFIDQLASGRAN